MADQDAPGEIPIAVLALCQETPLELALKEAGAQVDGLAGQARIVALLRRASLAALAAERDLATELVRAAAEARRIGLEAELELTTAFVALESGEPVRALGAIARARAAHPTPAQARFAAALELEAIELEQGAAAAMARIEGMLAGLDAVARTPVEVVVRLFVGRTAHAAGRRDLAEAQLRGLAGTERPGLLACDEDLLRADVLLDAPEPDVRGARAALSRAASKLVRLGAPRRLGLAYLAMARVEALEGGDGAAPASWLARALPLLARAAHRRDLERLRCAFRLHGRRELDRLLDAELASAIVQLRARHARLRDVLAAARDAREAGSRDVPDETAALDALERQQELVIAALEGLVIDRERARQLVRISEHLAHAKDTQSIVEAMPRWAVELCSAESAEVYAVRPDGSTEVLARHGPAIAIARARLEREVRQAIDAGQGRLFGREAPAGRGTAEGGARVAVVPVGLASGPAALVVARTSRGQLDERDLKRLTTYASLVATSLDRARATEALAEVAARDAATLEAAARAARSDVAILITGESGTGKEMLAQAIHNASPRAGAPFVGINVAAIPRELLESELFGYERGAFTGARSGGMVGKLELAGEGTVLLDEIGDMPWEMQAKLLRVLQERTVVRLGGRREVPIRARIIATTHRDLDEAVRAGTFRLDLYYRLSGVHLHLPALRERRGDVPLLVQHYLARIAAREGRPPLVVPPTLMQALIAYDWPGNVRELAHLIEGAASLLPADATELLLPPGALERSFAVRRAGGGSSGRPSATGFLEEPIPLAELEKRAFEHALRYFYGNVARAARALRVSRGTFYRKMRLYGFDADATKRDQNLARKRGRRAITLETRDVVWHIP